MQINTGQAGSLRYSENTPVVQYAVQIKLGITSEM